MGTFLLGSWPVISLTAEFPGTASYAPRGLCQGPLHGSEALHVGGCELGRRFTFTGTDVEDAIFEDLGEEKPLAYLLRTAAQVFSASGLGFLLLFRAAALQRGYSFFINGLQIG